VKPSRFIGRRWSTKETVSPARREIERNTKAKERLKEHTGHHSSCNRLQAIPNLAPSDRGGLAEEPRVLRTSGVDVFVVVENHAMLAPENALAIWAGEDRREHCAKLGRPRAHGTEKTCEIGLLVRDGVNVCWGKRKTYCCSNRSRESTGRASSSPARRCRDRATETCRVEAWGK
jgi:hypothetical protein